MVRLGKLIKRPFRKQNSSGVGSVGDSVGVGNTGELSDDSSREEYSKIIESVTTSYSDDSMESIKSSYSLSSDIRNHGPIDVDTCRKHKEEKKSIVDNLSSSWRNKFVKRDDRSSSTTTRSIASPSKVVETIANNNCDDAQRENRILC